MYRRLRRIGLGVIEVYLAFSIIGGVLLAELTLKPARWHLERPHQVSAYWHQKFGADLQDIAVTAQDGAVLKAWYETPAHGNGSTVLLLHGIGDNREGVAGYAEFFLQHGYSVLLPDSRAHGESGGRLATYGVLEADDVNRWVSWLKQRSSGCVYEFGESMGAAIALESLRTRPSVCGVVAESSFSTFRQVAYDRIGLYAHLGPWFGRSLGRLPVEIGILYARVHYGLDLTRANPLEAVEQSSVPVLLIHGAADVNILPWHSVLLRAADQRSTLWIVPHAAHTGAMATAPNEFQERVLQFLAANGGQQI